MNVVKWQKAETKLESVKVYISALYLNAAGDQIL